MHTPTVGPSQQRWDDRGAVVVEFALVMPLLIFILLGTITAGLALNDDLQLNHSTRDAARYGATVPENQAFTSGTWATNIQSVVVSRFGGDLTASDVCVALVAGTTPVPSSSAYTTDSGGGACFDDSGAGISDTRVQFSASLPATIETGLFTFDLTLSTETVSMHESNG